MMYLDWVSFGFMWLWEDYVDWPANDFHPAAKLEGPGWGGGRGEGGPQGSRWETSPDSLVAFVWCPVEGGSRASCCCSLPAVSAAPRGGGHLLFVRCRRHQNCFDSLGGGTCLQTFLGQRQNFWREGFSGAFSLRSGGGDPSVLGGFGKTVLSDLLWRLLGSCFLTNWMYSSAFRCRCWGLEVFTSFASRCGNTAALLHLRFHILGLDPNELWSCGTGFTGLVLVADSGRVTGKVFWWFRHSNGRGCDCSSSEMSWNCCGISLFTASYTNQGGQTVCLDYSWNCLSLCWNFQSPVRHRLSSVIISVTRHYVSFHGAWADRSSGHLGHIAGSLKGTPRWEHGSFQTISSSVVLGRWSRSSRLRGGGSDEGLCRIGLRVLVSQWVFPLPTSTILRKIESRSGRVRISAKSSVTSCWSLSFWQRSSWRWIIPVDPFVVINKI